MVEQVAAILVPDTTEFWTVETSRSEDDVLDEPQSLNEGAITKKMEKLCMPDIISALLYEICSLGNRCQLDYIYAILNAPGILENI